MQGWRKNMEDAHAVKLSNDEKKFTAFFGVYDGHNGQAVAKYCANNMLAALVKTAAFAAGEWDTAFKEAYMGIDEYLQRSPELSNEGGCTAISVLMADKKIICGNAGDSRAVLCRDGKPIPLSRDHKTTLDEEVKRIERAGGTVTNGRVNGTLGLTRAIGDFDFKNNKELPLAEQIVSAMPEVSITPNLKRDDFFVLACDGVWDVMTNEAICEFVSEKLRETHDDVGLTCEMVLDKCLATNAPGPGCDNMTIIIVQPKAEYKQLLDP